MYMSSFQTQLKAELVEYTSVTSSREMRVIQAIKMIN